MRVKIGICGLHYDRSNPSLLCCFSSDPYFPLKLSNFYYASPYSKQASCTDWCWQQGHYYACTIQYLKHWSSLGVLSIFNIALYVQTLRNFATEILKTNIIL